MEFIAFFSQEVGRKCRWEGYKDLKGYKYYYAYMRDTVEEFSSGVYYFVALIV